MNDLAKIDYQAINSVVDRERQAEKSLLGIYQLNISDVVREYESDNKISRDKESINLAVSLGINWTKFVSLSGMAMNQEMNLINSDDITSEFIDYLSKTKRSKISRRVHDELFKYLVRKFVRIKIWDNKAELGNFVSDEAKSYIPLMRLSKENRKSRHEAMGRAQNIIIKHIKQKGITEDIEEKIVNAFRMANQESESSYRKMVDTLISPVASMITAQSNVQDALMNTCRQISSSIDEENP